MSYFSKFPLVAYDAVGDGNYKLFTDLLRRVKLRTELDSTVSYDFYDVQSGDTPEMIAHKYYGDPTLHWVIIMINDVVDFYTDWPMDDVTFENYLNTKYGNNLSSVHHYEIEQTSGDTTKKINIGADNTDYPSATPISNYEYEVNEQDRKRRIRLLSPEYIERFVEEFQNKITEGTI